MTFFSFYAQPSCTPGRAAMQTGRIPNRSGMTTVAFQGQGGGLPAAEWTLASVLKQGGYKTYFTGKWHLGEADYALPNAQGYDEMKYGGLYHLNAYTYADPTWFPDMDPELRAMFQRVTKGALSGNAGEPAREEFKINGQYVDTPVIDGKEGVVGIPFFDGYVEKAALEYPRRRGQDAGQAVLHERQLHEGAPAEHAGTRITSTSRCRRANMPNSVVELDARIGRIMDKIRAIPGSTRTRWCSTRPTTAHGRTSIRMPATPRSAAPRAPCAKAATAFPRSPGWPGKIKPRARRTTRSSAAST